jgi:hypothetical protein
MMRASICCAMAVLVLGCETGEEPVRGARRGLDPVSYPPAERAPREPAEAPRPDSFPIDLGDLPAETVQEAERDLSSELRAAIGTPSECLVDFTASAPTKLRISVQATVRPTGMVITPSAYASGLSKAARQCIESRVSAVVLPALDEPLSQSVSTIVEIDYEPPVIVEAEPGVPEPRLKNVKEPLPKRPEVPPSGTPIQKPTSKWISGGFDGGRPIDESTSKKITGPKPRPIDGYEVDENAQQWSD